MHGELVPVGGGDPVPLVRTRLVVGRREGCDILLEFGNVSSRHCELTLIDGYWQVNDLGSSNGTKVNGVKVKRSWVLPGEELGIAKHRFLVEYDPPAGSQPPPPLDTAEDLQMSLLEKAGLARPERRPQPAPQSPKPRPGAAGNPPPGRPTTPEDEAFRWLQSDDE